MYLTALMRKRITISLTLYGKCTMVNYHKRSTTNDVIKLKTTTNIKKYKTTPLKKQYILSLLQNIHMYIHTSILKA